MAERNDTAPDRHHRPVNDSTRENIGTKPSNDAGTPDQGDTAVNMMTVGKLMSGTSATAFADIHNAPGSPRRNDSDRWPELRAEYFNRLDEERAFMATHIDAVLGGLEPGAERNAAIDRIPASIWAEDERLSDLRYAAEDVLMSHPSPDAAGFALKFLIAYGDDRDANHWNDMLEAEARRFAPAWISRSNINGPADRLAAHLARLDQVADDLPDDYGGEWVAAAQSLGLTVYAGFDRGGADYISIGARCDGTERETSGWIKSLSEHKDGVEGGRAQIINYIRKSPVHPFVDERTSAPSETTKAVRGFLAAGFRLFLDTRGEVQTGGAMPDQWWHGTTEQQREIGAYALAFDELRQKHNIEKQLRRIIRLVGTLHEGSGCIVLERKGN